MPLSLFFVNWGRKQKINCKNVTAVSQIHFVVGKNSIDTIKHQLESGDLCLFLNLPKNSTITKLNSANYIYINIERVKLDQTETLGSGQR